MTTPRIDSASRLISASPEAIYRAFAEPGVMERWLPPDNMRAEMLHFDFREGGSYRMRLTYAEPQQGQGKTSDDSDEIEVRLVKLERGRRIEQDVVFESEDPSYSGIMRMSWVLNPQDEGTLVTVHAQNVPEGIQSEDHRAGLNSSLEKLAALVESEHSRPDFDHDLAQEMSDSDRDTIILGIPKLPARYAALVLPLLLSIFMSGLVSLISTLKGVGPSPGFTNKWLTAWGVSWIVAYPVLLLILPVVRKLTSLLVRAP